jgi:hypothetical protein
LQHQRLDTSSTCLLVIWCLTTLLYGETNVLHTHIELIIDVIRGTRAPNCLNLFFNGPKSTEILDSHDAKIAITPALDFIPLRSRWKLDEWWVVRILRNLAQCWCFISMSRWCTTYFFMAGSYKQFW